MKKLLLLLSLFTATVFAAAPVVKIDSASNIFVDGVNYGQAADAIANNPQLASAIQVALVAFVKKQSDDAAQAIADHNAAKAAEIAALQEKAADRDAKAAQLATCAAYIALLQKIGRAHV